MKELPKFYFLVIISALLFVSLLFWLQLRSNQNLFRSSTSQEQPIESISFIPLYESDPIIGNRGADITIVAFEDFLCESCRFQHTLLRQLLAEYPTRIKIVWKDLSITTIPQSSELIHVFGYCMNQQGRFESFTQAMFENYIDVNQSNLETITRELGANMNQLSQCLTDGEAYAHLDKNKSLARALQIQSVPTFFVDDVQIVAPKTFSEWQQVLQKNDTSVTQ